MKKPPKAWAPVPVAVQIARHKAALAAAAKAAKAPAATRLARHNAAVRAAQTRKSTKKRQWSPDGDVALCSVRAVAAALGRPVSDGELLAVYFSITPDQDAGVSIAEAVAALPGRLVMPVLGVTWPQPHAVAVDPSGLWWSWGELCEPWTSDIDEAWGMKWSR